MSERPPNCECYVKVTVTSLRMNLSPNTDKQTGPTDVVQLRHHASRMLLRWTELEHRPLLNLVGVRSEMGIRHEEPHVGLPVH